MSVELLEALATDFLEYKNLVSFHIILEYRSFHYCTIYIRSTNLYICVISDEKYFLELHISTFGISEPLHKDFVSSFNLELLACNVYDCVHLKLV